MLNILARCLSLAVLTLPAAAQGQVWIVDKAGGPDADFTQIDDAASVAADGDTLLVRSGDYDGFSISSKSLRVIAESGAVVTVSSAVFAPAMVVGNHPAGATTLLRGLTFDAVLLGPGLHATSSLQLDHDQGTVWLESCKFFDGTTAAIVVTGAGDVVLENCIAKGGQGFVGSSNNAPSSPALQVQGGRVTVHGGSFTGADGISPGFSGINGGAGMPGIRLVSGELYLSATQCVGGKGGAAGLIGGGCNPPGKGGQGLLAQTGLVRLRDVALQGGAGGEPSIGGCQAGEDGVPYELGTATLETLDGLSSTLVSNSPVREGQTLTLRLTAEVGGPRTALLLAAQATSPTFVAALSGMGLLGGPTRRIELGTLDPATGIVTFSMAVPELGAGVLAAPWIFQAYVCAGGTCSAGGATHTLWLDSSL